MGKYFDFSIFQDLDLLISQIGNKMQDGNVRFSMKRKGQYSRTVFCLKTTQLFILSCSMKP